MAAPDGTRTRLTVTPANPKFTAALLPAGCFAGVLNLAWTLDRYDTVAVTNGVINVIGAVPVTLNVTAYAGQFSATGQLTVTVNTTDTTLAPVNAASNFAKPVTATDPMTILYPYNNTVLPTGLASPLIQWDGGGTAATAAKVSLRYPTTGTATYIWSEIIPEPAIPNAIIPQTVWQDFENTGKGNDVAFSVQRLIGTVPGPTLTRTLHFSPVPVRGLIYYTQYQRGGAASMMVADPGSAQTAHSAFATVSGCPVCHSVSAQGNYFATSDRISSGSANGGLSAILPGGSLNPLADFVATCTGCTPPGRATYSTGADWRGFAWAPLTPDGSFALSANNIWGNTNQTVVGIDSTNRVMSVPAPAGVPVVADSAARSAAGLGVMFSGGNGTGLLAQYFPNTTFTPASPLWKRIDPIVNFDFGTGSPGGLVPIDYSVRRSGQIQAFTDETYLFELETTDVAKLIINGTTVINKTTESASGAAAVIASGSLTMTAGVKVSIQLDQTDSANESSIKLWWSSPTVPRMLVPEAQLYVNDPIGTHGLEVNYYAGLLYAAPAALSRLEPDVYADWGTGNVATEVATTILPVDNFSSIWQGRIEAPYTGNVVFCVDTGANTAALTDFKLSIGGVAVITRVNLYNSNVCSGNVALTQGTLYPFRIDHAARTNVAALKLRWQYGGLTERIPTANFYTLSTPYAVPTNGLTVSYYGDAVANTTLPQNSLIQRSFTRYDANIYDAFGNGRTEFSQLTSTTLNTSVSDYWSRAGPDPSRRHAAACMNFKPPRASTTTADSGSTRTASPARPAHSTAPPTWLKATIPSNLPGSTAPVAPPFCCNGSSRPPAACLPTAARPSRHPWRPMPRFPRRPSSPGAT